MKKIFFILGVAALAVAGFAMFKILNFNDNGKEIISRNGSEAGNEAETQKGEGSQEAGPGEA